MQTSVILLLLFIAVSPAFSEIVFEDVSFGFDDVYKARKWVPLNILVRSQNEPDIFIGELTVEVRNYNSDEPIYRYVKPLRLGKTDRKHKKLYIYCPKIKIKLIIQLVRTGGSEDAIQTPISGSLVKYEFEPQTPIKNRDYFVLVLAPSGDKIEKFVDKKSLNESDTQAQANEDNTQAHVKYLPNSRAMPVHWIAYSAVDMLVIREVSLTDRRISKSQQNALLNWVQQGGTLLLSGGDNYQYLRGSFIEQHLPVKLIREETIDTLPSILKEKFGLTIEDATSETDNRYTAYKSIYFERKRGCQTLLGTDDQVFIAKRNFGSGQIICLSFNYNAPPFSNVMAGETFWRWLLKTHGKSPKRFADKYALFRQHDQKIKKHFLSKMPTQVPLIKLLATVLPLYLISWGVVSFYFHRRKSPPHKRIRRYWIGGLIIVLVSVSAIGIARVVLPKQIEIDTLSIITIYPEWKNAHLKTYVSLRSSAFTKTHLDSYQDDPVRPLLNEGRTYPATFFQETPFYLDHIALDPWSPSTYVIDTFFSVARQQNEIKLENAWIIRGEKAIQLGTITIGNGNILPQEPLSEIVKKIPPKEELVGNRKTFAQILQQEGLFLYLTKPENLLNTDEIQTRPVLIGWTSKGTPITQEGIDNIDNSETLVIMYLDEEDIGM